MKNEIKGLLQRLLWSIIKNGEAGISNAFKDRKVRDAEYEFDYATRALEELKKLEDGKEVDFENVVDALDDCTFGNGDDTTKEKIETMLDYGHWVAVSDFNDFQGWDSKERTAKEEELEAMYYPDNSLVLELARLIDGEIVLVD